MEPKFQKIISKYDYADQLAPGGFVIGGKPALTKIDGDLVGDYVIMTVRDPLLDYGGDPAELLSRRLENRVLAGQSGMFTTYSGYYKGAHISIVSGGSGSPEAELILVEFMQNSKANTFLRLGGGMAISEKLHSGDVVIAICFPRYSELALKTVQYAKDRGATIIGVTDSEMSPVYQMSSGSLLVRNEMISFVDSLAAPMSMLNALILAAAHKQGTDISATFNELEHVWDRFGIFGKVTK